MNAKQFKEQLVDLLSSFDEVIGIGQTGDINAPLIPGKSDIDLFVICTKVPSKQERKDRYKPLAELYSKLDMEVCNGGIWGYGDIFYVEDIDIMPMYFPVEEMNGYIEEVLAGKHLAKEGRFYPIGRLASIESLNVLYERDHSWTNIIDKVKMHPAKLFDDWYQNEVMYLIDSEDLGRSELRKEVLFYHQVLEEFLDHFLQALYAKNNCYFPSRKRSEQAIENFAKKPRDCYKRLLSIIQLSTNSETIPASIQELRALAEELTQL